MIAGTLARCIVAPNWGSTATGALAAKTMPAAGLAGLVSGVLGLCLGVLD
jgi:hypothetical protein